MANQPKKYKKFVATAATATLVASAIVPVASAASLSDIKGNTHEEAITSLVDAGVINGYPDGTFQPNKTLTRSDVVKLLGKYLVSKGLEVPADYKTNVRFNDLTSASNDELLKYAAVVYDAGVFSGSNGNLLAGDNITRENMAVVLVRAFDTLNNIDLVSYVQGQEYKKDVKDLFTAKAEARAAIEVLDFFDITNPSVANFNPKGSTTRGQFATFLYKTINTDFSAVTGVANGAVSEIKAINNTTVEVTFKDAIDNKEALDFTIDGLDVKNAVVKQTDAKTVVLTTAAQTGDKVYTLNVNAAKAGTFKGISAVVPTAIKLTTPSVQGTIGKEVTVKAEVTVPTGQSKAGIPVTFNIVNDNANLNEKKEVVAYTNEEGVATYTYTRYYKHNDNVTAYATDKSSVYASGKVYWAAGLTLTEVTAGNTLANGAKKVYKVVASDYSTETLGTAGTTDDYNYVNIAFVENTNVAPDKLVRDVQIIDTGVSNHTGYVQSSYPYQVTTGGVQTVRVKLNANGEATFTVTGANATVTPVVFVDNTTNKSGKYTETALQATVSPVKFEQNYTLGLKVEAKGVQNAAARTAKGDGGRKYVVTLTDVKTGAVAPAGSIVDVLFTKEQLSSDRAVYISYTDAAGKKVVNETIVAGKAYKIPVAGKEGQAAFTLTGAKDGFATPTVFVDNSPVGLDKSDLQVVGEGTYFVDAVVNDANLSVTDEDGEDVKDLVAGKVATFTYQSVDQNGFDYFKDTGLYEVTYQVTAQFGDVTVRHNGTSTTVEKGSTKSIKVWASSGTASIDVTSTVPSTVSVEASSSQVSLPNKSATVNFTTAAETTLFSGDVIALNPSTKNVWVQDASGKVEKFSYAPTSDFYDNTVTAGVNTPLTQADFLAKLGTGAKLTYKKVGDTKQFFVTTAGSATALPTAPPTQTVNTAPVAKTIVAKTVAANGTALTFTANDVATDADGDTLAISAVYTDNPAVATASVSSPNFTVTPVAVGTTTVNVVVSDGNGGFVTNTFVVNVTPAVFFNVLGNPGVPYTETAAKPATTEFTPAAGALTLTLVEDVSGAATNTTLALTATADADALATLINNQASLEGKAGKFIAVSNGTKVKVTSPAGDNTIVASGVGATSVTNVAGSDVVKNPAAYSFKVAGVPAAGKVITVTIGSETFNYTVLASDVSGGASTLASSISTAAALPANATFNAKYTASVSNDVVIFTQKSGQEGPTTGKSLSVTNN